MTDFLDRWANESEENAKLVAQELLKMANLRKIKAVEGSIAKWERILKAKNIIEDDGIDDCPLCIEYYDDECRDCPIAEHTGGLSCSRGPYPEWLDASSRARMNDKEWSQECKLAARYMVGLLKTILRGIKSDGRNK